MIFKHSGPVRRCQLDMTEARSLSSESEESSPAKETPLRHASWQSWICFEAKLCQNHQQVWEFMERKQNIASCRHNEKKITITAMFTVPPCLPTDPRQRTLPPVDWFCWLQGNWLFTNSQGVPTLLPTLPMTSDIWPPSAPHPHRLGPQIRRLKY